MEKETSQTVIIKKPKKESGIAVVLTCVSFFLLTATIIILLCMVAINISIIKHNQNNNFIEIPKLEQKEPQKDDVLEAKPYDGTAPNVLLNEKPDTLQELSTEQIAEQVGPSVVGIINHQANMVGYSTGTGIIFSQDGFIITNAHVVDNAQRIEVILHDGKILGATLIGADPRTDLAVVKIEGTNYKVAQLGDSTQVLVGERAIAIGNPGGLSNTVTQGIISAVQRKMSVPVKEDLSVSLTLLQTDASINPGNSGGPLVNKFGQVIGINSAKISSDSYEGIGFAIPTSDAKPIVEELIVNGKIKNRALLGITAVDVEKGDIAPLTPPSDGIYILEISKQSPLKKEGVQVGDIILSINGDSSMNTEDLVNLVKKSKPGDEVEMEIFLTDTNKTINVTIQLIEDILS